MMYETKYYVNNDKRTVVCVLTCGEFSAMEFIENGGDFAPFVRKAIMPTKFIGKAKCAPGDTFDENVGKTLAFTRAKTKFDKSLINGVRMLTIKQYEVYMRSMRRLDDYVRKAIKHQQNRLDEVEAHLNK